MRFYALIFVALFAAFTGQVRAENLFYNSSFECGLAGWQTFGTRRSTQYGTDYAPSTHVVSTNGVGRHGAHAIWITSYLISAPMYLTNGLYFQQFDCRGDSATTISAEIQQTYLITTEITGTNYNITTSWATHTNTFYAPSNGWYVFTLKYNNSAVTVWFDKFSLTPGPTPVAYAPASVIEVGLDTIDSGNNLFLSDARTVRFRFWNDGPLTNMTAPFEVLNLWNTNLVRSAVSTNALAANTNTIINYTLPALWGWQRINAYITNLNNTWTETTVSLLPYAAGSGRDTNGLLGLHSQFSEYHLTHARRMGFTWTRVASPMNQSRWTNVFPEPLSYDPPNINEFSPGVWNADFQYIWMRTNDLTPFTTLAPSDNEWRTTTNASKQIMIEQWVMYVSNMVARYKGTNKYWEIFNEPQQDNPSIERQIIGPRYGSNYAWIATNSAKIIKDIDPTAVVIGFGGYSSAVDGLDAWSYMQSFSNLFDFLAFHSYPQDQQRDPNSIEDDNSYSVVNIGSIARAFKPYGKPLWNTETASYSVGGYHGARMLYDYPYRLGIYDGSGWTSHAWYNEFNVVQLPEADRFTYNFLRTVGWGFYQYNMQNGASLSIDQYFAAHPTIYELNGTVKPEIIALLTANYFVKTPGLGRATNATLPIVTSYYLEAYKHTNTFGSVMPVWFNNRTNHTLTFSASSSYPAVYDLMGNLIQTNQQVVKLDRSVKYLVTGSLTISQLEFAVTNGTIVITGDAGDTTAPGLTLDVSPIGRGSIGPGITNLFAWTAIDENSLPWASFASQVSATNVLYRWSIDGGTGWTDWSQSNHVYMSFTNTGTYVFIVQAKDRAGNISSASSPTFFNPAAGAPPLLLGSWTFREPFGVSFPTQVFSLSYSGATNLLIDAKLLEVRGVVTNELYYQPLASSNLAALAIRANLPAGGTNTYYLVDGAPSATPVLRVTVVTNTEFYQLTNASGAGVRVLRNGKASATSYFPVQGFKMANGAWAASNALMLISGTELNQMGGHDFTMDQVPSGLISSLVESTVTEFGPLRAQVRVVQSFTRPGYISTAFDAVLPGGVGYITNYITMKAGEKYWTHHVQTDWRWRTALNYYTNAPFNEVRFLAHSTSDHTMGYWTNGPGIRVTNKNSGGAASLARRPMGDWNVGWVATSTVSTNIFPLMDAFDYQSENNGPTATTILTNSGTTNAVGVFTCNPAWAMGAVAAGPSIYRNVTNNQGGILIDVSIEQTIGLATNIAFAYGVIIGTGNDFMSTGVGAPSITELARNKETFGTLDQVTRTAGQTDYPDPSVGWTNIFTTAADLVGITNIIRTVPATSNAWWSAMVFSPPESRSAIEIAGAGEARSHLFVTNEIKLALRNGLSNYVSGFGIFQADYATYEGMDDYVRYFVSCALVMAYSTNQVDKADLRGLIAWAAYWLNSQDFWPAANRSNGLYRAQFEQPIFSWFGLGLYNQFVQALSMANMSTLMMDAHPTYTNRMNQIASITTNLWDGFVSSDGWVSNEGLGYQKTGTEPMVLVALMLQRRGVDLFAIPSWTNNLEYQMQMLTPFEPRFGRTYRVMPPSGDASPQLNGAPGMFSSGPRYHGHTALAARSLHAWTNSDSAQDDYFVPSPFTFYTNVTISPGGYRNFNFERGWNVWRGSSAGNAATNETYIMFEHAKAGGHSLPSAGQLSFYANGNPVMLPPGNTYSPELNSITTCSVLAPESSWTNWYGTGFESLQNSLVFSNQPFWYAFTNGGKSAVTLTNSNGSATRTVTTVFGADPMYPVILVRDTMRGNLANSNMLAMYNLLGSNTVVTSWGGTVAPPYAAQLVNTSATVYYLGPAQHHATFQGEIETNNWASGEDVRAVVNTVTSNQVLMRITGHEYIANNEGVDYILAHSGRTFTLRYHQLVVRGTNEIETCFLPAPKEILPASLVTTNIGGVWILTNTTNRTEVATNYYSLTNSGTVCVASLNDVGITNSNFRIVGGVAEATVRGLTNLHISVHGPQGARFITAPGTRFPQMRVSPYADGRPFTIRGG